MSIEVSLAPAHDVRLAASPLKPMLGIALIVTLSLAGFAVGLGYDLRGSDLTLLALAIATAASGFLPFALDTGRPLSRRHVLLSVVAIVYGISFSVPVFYKYIPAVGPVDPAGMSFVNITAEDVARAQLLGLVGLLLVYAGYVLPVRGVLGQLVPPARYEWSQRGAFFAVATLIPLGWALTLAAAFGLLPERVGSGLVGGLAGMALVSSALLTATYLRHGSRLSLVLLVVLVPLTSGFNALTSSKRLMLLPWALVAVTYMVYTRRVRLRWMVAGVLVLALIYPAAQYYRDVVLAGSTRSFAEVLADPSGAVEGVTGFAGSQSFARYLDDGLAMTTARIDAVGIAAVIVRDTPSVVPFQYGRTLAQIVYGFVPRILWPDKPAIGIGIWINDNYNNSEVYLDSHLGPSWIGELYLNFALPGVVIGMLFIGAAFRVCHELLAGRPRTTPMVLAEVMILKDVAFSVTGGLVAVFNGPVMAILPLIGMHMLLRSFGGVQRIDPSP